MSTAWIGARKIDVLDLFPEERAALLDLLEGISDEEWQRPTVCAGWAVKDVALHLLGDDIGTLSGHRDGYRGPPTATPADLTTLEKLVAYIDERNDVWVRATRRISAPLLCDLLRLTGRQFVEFYRTLDLDATGGPVNWAGPEPAPVWFDVAREFTERWIHQQQIRDAVGRPGLTERRFLFPVLDTFARALPFALRTTVASEGSRVRLVVTGDAGGAWPIRRSKAGWTFDTDDTADADATVTIDQDLAWRLFTKGVTPEEAATVVAIDGDRALGEPVLGMVSILA